MSNLIENQKKHFESISDKYYIARKNKNHLLYKKLMWDFFFKDKAYYKKTSKLNVLEPMCGYAEGYDILSRYRECYYTGFDYSEVLVNRINSERPELNVFFGDVTQFKPDKKYDLVIIIGGLHHVHSFTQKVLDIVNESLVPGGRFICLEPTQNNFIFKWVRERIYKKNTLFDDETEQAFDLQDLNYKFKESRFEIIDQIYPGLLSYVLYYNPDAFPFLNKGGAKIVKFLFRLDSLFFRNKIGGFFSFATLTEMKKMS